MEAHVNIVHDEPAKTDLLDRRRFAEALAEIIATCDTPLVIGLYGTWGMGKTSLMKLIDAELTSSSEALTVWFDPWQHQFDEDPAVALLHTMVDDLGLGEEARRLLTLIAGALGSFLLKATTTLGIADLRELDQEYQEQRFEIREKQIRLRNHFSDLLMRATGNGRIRLVFFIDDLDRCLPDHVLRVLEALKLYLNMPGCVYVLGVDRSALESSIRHRYQTLKVSEAEYLDKIVQLPFVIPPLSPIVIEEFVRRFLPDALASEAEIVAATLGENPRQVKRFVNGLLLNHRLAERMFDDSYDAKLLVAVLVMQYRHPELFKEMALDDSAIDELSKGAEGRYREQLEPGSALSHLVTIFARSDSAAIRSYLHLSEVAGVRATGFDVVLVEAGEKRIQVIKEIRGLTGLGLKEAMELTDSPPDTPGIILSGVTREEAEAAKRALESAGARVTLA